MVVRVIAVSKFLGVPLELTENRGIGEGQDKGSDCARLIECAGRTCYDSYGAGRISSEYHKHILEVGHGSVLEHAHISFFISGISRGCSHEWVRHRHANISQRSTRYVDEYYSPWEIHPVLSDAIEWGKVHEDEAIVRATNSLGTRIVSLREVSREIYKNCINVIQTYLEQEKGVDKFTARKQARGAARGYLGNALQTEMVWTCNVRALRGLLEQRCSKYADAEIRLLANKVYSAVKDVCPEYFSDYTETPCPDGIGFEISTLNRKV